MNFSIADGQPISCIYQCAERLRQAFVGYENLPHGTEKQPLRVYVHDSYNRDKLRLGVNEFQALVNCLPIAVVCSETRSQAIAFCRAQIRFMNLFYIIDAPDEPSDIGEETLEPIFWQRMTVMITNANDKKDGPKGFDTAKHLVSVVDRVFGSSAERTILSSWLRNFNTMKEINWPTYYTNAGIKSHIGAQHQYTYLHTTVRTEHPVSRMTKAMINLLFS